MFHLKKVGKFAEDIARSVILFKLVLTFVNKQPFVIKFRNVFCLRGTFFNLSGF